MYPMSGFEISTADRRKRPGSAPGVCPICAGDRWLDDPSACTDPEHCSPMYPCPTCNPDGELD